MKFVHCRVDHAAVHFLLAPSIGAAAPSDPIFTPRREAIVSKNQNTFQKRRREYDKKQKAEEKRQRKLKMKAGCLEAAPIENEPGDAAEAQATSPQFSDRATTK
jgi:hypothetical protein